MAKPKTECTTCGMQILQRTADRNEGICGVCVRSVKASRVDRTCESVPVDPVKLDITIDVAALGDSRSIAWQRVEDGLCLIASQYIQAFGAAYRDNTFYGFAFDCNADYSQVFICANTPDDLTTRATQYKAQSPDLYSKQSIAELEESLRWSLGDWKFQAFTTEGFSDAWKPIEEFLVDATPWGDVKGMEEFRKSFMDTACRSMVRLESQGVLIAISQADDFKTFVADHDELDSESWSRLEAIHAANQGKSGRI